MGPRLRRTQNQPVLSLSNFLHTDKGLYGESITVYSRILLGEQLERSVPHVPQTRSVPFLKIEKE